MSESGRMMGPAEERANVKRAGGKNAAVTMRDVATQSGFSPATVSIVLNNAPLARYIAPATKKRIEEVARWIEEGSMTVDASLATLDCMLRRQWIDEEVCAGIEALFEPPAIASTSATASGRAAQ